jgi:hypothetical protein
VDYHSTEEDRHKTQKKRCSSISGISMIVDIRSLSRNLSSIPDARRHSKQRRNARRRSEKAGQGYRVRDVELAEVLGGLPDGGEVGVAVGDVELNRQKGVAVVLDETVRSSRLRAVPATLSPHSRAASVHSRPKPFDAPVMNQVLVRMTPMFTNYQAVTA